MRAGKASTHRKKHNGFKERTDNPEDLKYSAAGSTKASMVETSQENKKKLPETRRF